MKRILATGPALGRGQFRDRADKGAEFVSGQSSRHNPRRRGGKAHW
jgi:hypothetical protein